MPVCDHTLQRHILICAPSLNAFPSHISVANFIASIFPFFQTFGKYIVFQTDNFLQPVIKIIFDMCPAVAHICHRLHYVQINHINNFFIINPINRLNDFKISLLRYVPQPRTYPSAYSLCCGCLMSLGGFDPPPPTLKLSVRSHYATMTRLICAPFAKCFSIAHIRHRLHCVHLPTYHRVVSINRPSGYEPDALPLRHDDFVCPHHTHINISVAFKLFTNIL